MPHLLLVLIQIVYFTDFIKIFVLLVNVGEDCPVFDGLYEFCQISTGGSVGEF